ncbi:MAG: ABC transporter permease [Chloroflexi bacterium]|jgi:ABC-2 type transport system permease protein|nr:ABC transporter permease [Chloroflexota bacterium]MBT5628196.1 ABC transporter permease [Chloroflexota bacterium]
MFGKTDDARIIFEEEFSRQLRRTSWRVFTFGVPIIMLLVTYVLPLVIDNFSDDESTPKIESIGYVDHSGVTDSLAEIPGLLRMSGLDIGTQALADDEIKAFFVIPEDYVATGNVDWYRRGSGLAAEDSSGDAFFNVLRMAVADGGLSETEVARILQPATYSLFKVDELGRPDSSGSVKDEIAQAAPAFVFALLLLFSIFVGSGSLLQSVTEEKENRMIEMLVTSASSMSIMLGKILGLGAAGLLQIAIWLSVAAFAIPQISQQFNGLASLTLDPLLMVLLVAYYFAGYFVFAAFMASIGAASTSVREASQISAIVMIPGVVPIYLSAVIIPSPDGGLARALTFFPLTSSTASMMRIAGGTEMTYEIFLGLATTALAGVGLLWLSARVFRAGLLLYGQRMGIRTVWQALRYAD